MLCHAARKVEARRAEERALLEKRKRAPLRKGEGVRAKVQTPTPGMRRKGGLQPRSRISNRLLQPSNMQSFVLSQHLAGTAAGSHCNALFCPRREGGGGRGGGPIRSGTGPRYVSVVDTVLPLV